MRVHPDPIPHMPLALCPPICPSPFAPPRLPPQASKRWDNANRANPLSVQSVLPIDSTQAAQTSPRRSGAVSPRRGGLGLRMAQNAVSAVGRLMSPARSRSGSFGSGSESSPSILQMAQGTARFKSAAPHRDEGAVMASPMASAQRKHGFRDAAAPLPPDAVAASEVGATPSMAPGESKGADGAEEKAEAPAEAVPAEAEEKAAAMPAEEKAEAKQAEAKAEAKEAPGSGGDSLHGSDSDGGGGEDLA